MVADGQRPYEGVPAITVSDYAGLQSIVQPHPQADDILRQIEYYFSDENLRQDAHLLALTGGDGNGPVRLSEVLSFPKMRKFKQRAKVKEAIRASGVIEFVDEKHIRRRFPLSGPLYVEPKLSENRMRQTSSSDKPWLTKGMLKPTGFEENDNEDSMSPQELAENKRLYKPEDSIASRLETAVRKFCEGHKMHQNLRRVFVAFLLSGGFQCNNKICQGGVTNKKREEEGANEDATGDFLVAEDVEKAIFHAQDGKPALWIVDFEAVAKEFLGSRFIQKFNWYNEEEVKTATRVLRKFYNYLTLKEVCMEYADQLAAALSICDVAEAELPGLAKLDQSLPGAFNVACSTLFKGTYAGLYRTIASDQTDDDNNCWIHIGDNIGLSGPQADIIFKAAIAAFGTEEQNREVRDGHELTVVSEQKLGLEVTRMEFPSQAIKDFYGNIGRHYPDETGNSFVQPMGKLICQIWDVPFAPSLDLPSHVIRELSSRKTAGKEYAFILEEDTLRCCVPGMKMEALVKELDIGIQWLDHLEAVYPSFFIRLLNEEIMKWKEPGEPKEWMLRQNLKKNICRGVGVAEKVDEENHHKDQTNGDTLEPGSQGQEESHILRSHHLDMDR
ncbi:hypothetical protein M433DRAFT_163800 [Acidomyces richmondensis BFW]|nr:MAG: hypothetical protein FE78DRAFT_103803 [Acidomyces sp. 'richmondensis']KYG48034.1 hypothetical protein M433DRAFT_163800 [Acidomyces richmondensis BFW]